jgi:hypothetical protein
VLIEISPETSSHELRKKNKDHHIFYTNEEMEECLDHIKTKGNVKVQLFFGFYLSSDTRKTIFDTILYICQLLMKYPGMLEIEYDNFSTDPGSLFFFFPEKYEIEMKTRNFKDYCRHLKENYVKRKGQGGDMTVFKPISISDEENEDILRRHKFFNYLLISYRKSISYMLEKTGTPGFIIKLLEESDISPNEDNKFSPDEVKILLLECADKNGLTDMYLSKLIGFEREKLDSGPRMSKPTTQLFLDFERERSLLDEKWFEEVSTQHGETISKEIKSSREHVEADFDF